MDSVFAALSQGEGVTKGLRKVDKSEMTHKNPELRKEGVVPSSIGGGGAFLVPPCPFPLLLSFERLRLMRVEFDSHSLQSSRQAPQAHRHCQKARQD